MNTDSLNKPDPMAEDDSRVCIDCKVKKPLTDFYKNRSNTYEWRCKDCKRVDIRKRYYSNPEPKLIRNEKRRSITANRLRTQALRKPVQRAEYPTKGKARHAIATALKKGTITKLPCEECGETKTDFHHAFGYDVPNWLKGQWLCRSHHLALHRKGVPNG